MSTDTHPTDPENLDIEEPDNWEAVGLGMNANLLGFQIARGTKLFKMAKEKIAALTDEMETQYDRIEVLEEHDQRWKIVLARKDKEIKELKEKHEQEKKDREAKH